MGLDFSQVVYFMSSIILLADYLIDISKDWVIFIRTFQSIMLIINMAQIHQNTTL